MNFDKNKSRTFRNHSLGEWLVQAIKKKCLKGNITYGDNFRILGKLPLVKTPRSGRILLGNNVTLNSDFMNSNSALTTAVKLTTGYEGVIEIGNNSILNGSCVVAYKSVEIGSYCEIASCTVITDTYFHPVSPDIRLKQMKGEPFSFGEVNKASIKIGNNCWIGYGSIILKGVRLGNNCIVAAGTIIPGNSVFPDNCIIAGNPRKTLKYF